MQPIATRRAPAIISQCGNFKLAKRDSHTVSTQLAHLLKMAVFGFLEPRSTQRFRC
ncbi:hypothetical protein GA0061098_1014130 [Bradyrhizobium shewense]|uniref:Uncharacterized protein n=1 Tax=Bradyrhizobium shewense TaxID=1761772 RepID=A0A1C3XDX4_9BRAD|nr:hypothetical protein GA0061098_1014130 [Bradyrhizobium shewense]